MYLMFLTKKYYQKLYFVIEIIVKRNSITKVRFVEFTREGDNVISIYFGEQTNYWRVTNKLLFVSVWKNPIVCLCLSDILYESWFGCLRPIWQNKPCLVIYVWPCGNSIVISIQDNNWHFKLFHGVLLMQCYLYFGLFQCWQETK